MKKTAEKASVQTEANTPGTVQNDLYKKSEKTNSNSSDNITYKIHVIEKSPIAILEDSQNGFTPICQNQRLILEWYKTKEELEKRIKKIDWELIIPAAITAAKILFEEETAKQK